MLPHGSVIGVPSPNDCGKLQENCARCNIIPWLCDSVTSSDDCGNHSKTTTSVPGIELTHGCLRGVT